MATFVKFVRPFVTQDVTPPQRIVDSKAPDPVNVVKTFGDKGRGKVYNASFSSSITTHADKRISENLQKGNVCPGWSADFGQ